MSQDLPAGFDFRTLYRAPHQSLRSFLEQGDKSSETRRGLDDYAALLKFSSANSLINILRDKRVLDLGSGGGMLAKECAQRGVSSEIHSLNPRLAVSKWRMRERQATRKCVYGMFASYYFDWLVRIFSKQLISKEEMVAQLQSTHDATAVAALADQLPYKDASFDVILDMMGPIYYSATVDELYFNMSEALRVLKPGGMMLCGASEIFMPHRIDYIQVMFGRWYQFFPMGSPPSGFCLVKSW